MLRAILMLLAGGALAQALPLLLGPWLTRLYRPADFGVYHLFMAVAANLAVVACARYEFALPLAADEAQATALRTLCLRVLAGVTALSALAALAWAAWAGALWPLALPVAVGGLGGLSLATLNATRAQRFSRLALARVLQHGGGALLQVAAGLWLAAMIGGTGVAGMAGVSGVSGLPGVPGLPGDAFAVAGAGAASVSGVSGDAPAVAGAGAASLSGVSGDAPAVAGTGAASLAGGAGAMGTANLLSVTALIAAPIAAALAALLALGWPGPANAPRARWWAAARAHRSFPLLNTPHAFLGALQDTLAIALIAASLGPAAAGAWGLALRYLKAPATLVGGAVAQVLYPKLLTPAAQTVAAGTGCTDAGRALVRRTMVLLALLAAPLVAGLWWLGPGLFAWAFGPAWAPAGDLARALALYIGLHFVASPLGVVTMAWQAQAWALKLALVGQALFVAALALGLAFGGLAAAGWAVSLAMLAYFGWYFSRLATWPLAPAAPPAPAAAAPAGTASAAPGAGTASAAPVSGGR